ncbi:uracil-DNA glycosylase [Weissella uvarum]|uniref:uracil-DNA glycosylase n=1 Tax=Weissella uvarum TaxID=1479233 RepID=UPI0019622328|nr:uracil-DNA glycosylase [Weissella uvarum]MBM7618005.1 uracil-DNA glycosylase [Weissella uvarum]MCM0596224.1 uracil-DNA glycosylase [Weissella uvarum]
MADFFDTDWAEPLVRALPNQYFEQITNFLTQVYAQETVYPSRDHVFAALEQTSLAQTKVVLLGQDPYIKPGQAQGLSFSVPADFPLPPSLRNIYQELQDDLQQGHPANGDLHPWAKQGVLLLNTVLTVPAGQSNGHAGLIWEPFTDEVIRLVAAKSEAVVFVLWGKPAQKKANLIQGPNNLILKAPHPSPLSAYRGFFGSKPFSQTNQFLLSAGRQPIDWVNGNQS